jgi:hypothetical protein
VFTLLWLFLLREILLPADVSEARNDPAGPVDG